MAEFSILDEDAAAHWRAVEESSERIELQGKRIAKALASVPGAADWEKVDVLTDALLVFVDTFKGCDSLMSPRQKLARHFIDKATSRR